MFSLLHPINTWLNAAYSEASLLGPNTLIEHNTPMLEFNGYEQRPIAALIKELFWNHYQFTWNNSKSFPGPVKVKALKNEAA